MLVQPASEVNHSGDCLRCAELIVAAELELGAFMLVVGQRHGDAVAQLAGTFWVTELESMESFFDENTPDWRVLTVAAVSRLKREGRIDLHEVALVEDWRLQRTRACE
jgi:hypothetical protein